MYSPWLQLGPECIYWGVRNVCHLWKPKAIYITENGTSSDDAGVGQAPKLERRSNR